MLTPSSPDISPWDSASQVGHSPRTRNAFVNPGSMAVPGGHYTDNRLRTILDDPYGIPSESPPIPKHVRWRTRVSSTISDSSDPSTSSEKIESSLLERPTNPNLPIKWPEDGDDAYHATYSFNQRLSLIPQPSRCDTCPQHLPYAEVVHVERCGHKYCDGCLRSYVQDRIKTNSCPIRCPLCDRNGGYSLGPPPVLREHHVEKLGLSPSEAGKVDSSVPDANHFQRWVECPNCKIRGVVFVTEFTRTRFVKCRARDGCQMTWCHLCDTIVEDTDKHLRTCPADTTVIHDQEPVGDSLQEYDLIDDAESCPNRYDGGFQATASRRRRVVRKVMNVLSHGHSMAWKEVYG